jgi:protease inhibitor Inh
MIMAARMRRTVRAGMAAAWALAVLPAAAQQDPGDAVKAMVGGSWEFSNADRDKRCTITFRTDRGGPGMKLEFDKDCASLFPFIKEIAAWSIAENDFLRLLDAKGKPVLEFSEVESGMYEAPRPGEGILFIQSTAAAGPAPRQPAEMAGTWDIIRGGDKPICTLNLANTAAGQELALTVRPGCDAFVTRFAPLSWQMDRTELVLRGARGATWRFSEGDTSTTWQRVPEGPEPLLLMKR